MSATFLKMDSELDKVLAKARRVRTGEQKVKSESESEEELLIRGRLFGRSIVCLFWSCFNYLNRVYD